MAKRITATDAVRQFSDLLSSIKFKGSRYTIIRGGKPVASLGPSEAAPHDQVLGELKTLLKTIPRLGEEAEAFGKDLKAAARKQPGLPKGRAWE